MAHCTQCGVELCEGARFCNQCGASVRSRNKPKPGTNQKNTKTARTRKQTTRNTALRQKKPSQQARTASKRPKRQTEEASSVPDKFLPLLRYIIAKTFTTFLKRLPITLAIGLAAWLFHTFLLVVVNDGFGKNSAVRSFIALQGQVFSAAIIWTVGSGVLMGLMAWILGRRSGFSLKDRITAVTRYLASARMDACSVFAGGIGISLLIAAYTNSTASLALAVGMGALIASRAGSVISLLLRTAWNTLFTTVRHRQVRRYGMAAGYTGMFAASLGFVVNSVIPFSGIVPGVVLMGIAIAIGLQGRHSSVVSGILLFITGTVAFNLLGDMGFVLAHDGGWSESGRSLGRWITSQGAMTAIILGVGPAVGSAVGAAFGTALTDIGSSMPPDDFDNEPDSGGTSGQPPGPSSADPHSDEDRHGSPPNITNPYDDTAFETDGDGNYWAPDENGQWQWMSASQAMEAAAALQVEVDRRDRERQAFDRETDRLSEQRRRDHEREAAEAELRQTEEQARQERIDDLLRRGQGMISQVDDPVRAQQLEDFLDRHRNDPAALERAVAAIRSQTFEADQQRTMGESEAALEESSELQRSERLATNIQTAAKAGIAATGGAMVTGGATTLTTAMAWAAGATGAISGSEAGSESYQRGDNLMAAAKNVAGATAIGAAEGALAVGTNLPGTGMGVRMAGSLGQGMASAADHLRRGGSAGGAVLHGAITFVGGVAGHGVNAGLGTGAMGQAADMLVAGSEGGLHSKADGRTFGEGFERGVEGWGAAKIGGGLAGRAAQHASDYTPSGQTPTGRQDTETAIRGDEGKTEPSTPVARPGTKPRSAPAPPPSEMVPDGQGGHTIVHPDQPTVSPDRSDGAHLGEPTTPVAQPGTGPRSAPAPPPSEMVPDGQGGHTIVHPDQPTVSPDRSDGAHLGEPSTPVAQPGKWPRSAPADEDVFEPSLRPGDEGEPEPPRPPGYDPNDPAIQEIESRRQQLVESRNQMPDEEMREMFDDDIARADREIAARSNDLHHQELQAGMVSPNRVVQDRDNGCYEAAAAGATGRPPSDMRAAAQEWLDGYTDNPDAQIPGLQVKGFLDQAGLNPRRPMAALTEAEEPYIDITNQMQQATLDDDNALLTQLGEEQRNLPNRPQVMRDAVSDNPDQLRQSLEESNIVVGMSDRPHMVSLQGGYTDAQGNLWIREIDPAPYAPNEGVNYISFNDAVNRYNWDSAYAVDYHTNS